MGVCGSTTIKAKTERKTRRSYRNYLTDSIEPRDVFNNESNIVLTEEGFTSVNSRTGKFAQKSFNKDYVMVEYIWLGGSGNDLRGKTKIVKGPIKSVKN